MPAVCCKKRASPANCAVSDAGDETGKLATSLDGLLGGRLPIRQPGRGHRAGSDAILLAAAAPAEGVDRIVDLGAGVGAVGLAILQRLRGASADLVERDAALAALAEENAMRNGLQAQTRIHSLDFMQARDRRNAGLRDGAADLVVTNPPFFEAANVRASPNARKASAHVFAGGPPVSPGKTALEAWIIACLALLCGGGRFIMIHRAGRARWDSRRIRAAAGLGMRSCPFTRTQAPAHRILVAGVKGARGPISLRAALTLHDRSGAFTPLAEAIHRGEALIDWGVTKGGRRINRRLRRVDRRAPPH